MIEVDYKFGERSVLDLKSILDTRKNAILSKGGFDDGKGLTIAYNADWFRINIRKDISIKPGVTYVSYHTTETLEGDDRVYVMGVVDPTYNFSCRLNLVGGMEGWKISGAVNRSGPI